MLCCQTPACSTFTTPAMNLESLHARIHRYFSGIPIVHHHEWIPASSRCFSVPGTRGRKHCSLPAFHSRGLLTHMHHGKPSVFLLLWMYSPGYPCRCGCASMDRRRPAASSADTSRTRLHWRTRICLPQSEKKKRATKQSVSECVDLRVRIQK